MLNDDRKKIFKKILLECKKKRNIFCRFFWKELFVIKSYKNTL